MKNERGWERKRVRERECGRRSMSLATIPTAVRVNEEESVCLSDYCGFGLSVNLELPAQQFDMDQR